ncbi:MAG: rubrerythrin family protein [Spirochaetales bacterium]|jgi:vacuolar iron transporter family protein|nr:rubrerythrin family protein [Spirochaetales bacterium]
MNNKNFDLKITKTMILAQRIEMTEFEIYSRLAKSVKDENNSKVLQRIADDELRHADFWEGYTGREVKAHRWKVFKFFWIARLLGLTFGIKLLEKGEMYAQQVYDTLTEAVPEAKAIIIEEEEHEHTLIGMIEEDGLKYMGSIVLGLNDALVELTGALAGLTFAFRDTQLIALAGLITGIAASFSMAASEYLSARTDNTGKHALKSAIYTGLAYVITVILLILPYLIISHYLICLALTIAVAIIIIFLFNYYISVARDLSFRRRFVEMAAISLGVSFLSFGIGYLIRIFLRVEI